MIILFVYFMLLRVFDLLPIVTISLFVLVHSCFIVDRPLQIIGNILLIPILGSKGAAVSTGLSYIVFFTLRTFFSNRYFPIDFKLKKFYLLTAVFAAGSWYHMYHSFDLVIVGIFVVTMSLIFILYTGTIKEMIDLGLEQLERFLPGRSRD